MQYRDGAFQIGDVSAGLIAAEFGTPVYVYDAGVLQRQIDRIREAFQALPVRPYYAMKANANLAILRLLRAGGFGCDAVSPGEIYLAMKAGFTPEEIWFTCSNVSDEDLRSIPDPRIVINVNSMSEIDRCLALDLPNPIALRINPDVGAGHHHDVVTAGEGVKFGIDLAEVEQARIVVEDSGREVVGLHAHIGSGIADPAPLLASAQALLNLAPSFRQLRWMNFGGGIGVPYFPGDEEFPLESYGRDLAELVGPALNARGITAIIEPGRFMVAECGTLIARVTACRVSAGRDWIGCDTGFNHLVRPSKYGAYHHIVNLTRGDARSLRTSFDPQAMLAELIVSGNLCESGDVFTRDASGMPQPRRMDPTAIGDLIAFCDAGAYGFSMASQYNARLLPPEVLVDRGQIRVIRRRERIDELMGGMT